MESTVLQPQSRVLQHVPRWGIIRTIRQQSVAEHSYYVALYATYIAKKLNLMDLDCQWVTQAALVHDFEEMVSGDIPTPYKKYIGKVDDERIMGGPRSMALSIMTIEPRNRAFCEEIIRVADLFEAAMYLRDEYHMGNCQISDLMRYISDKFHVACKKLDEDLWEEINTHIDDPIRTRLLSEFGLS